LDTDIGLADTFLHPRERTFSVSQCLDLVEQAGLAFGGFEDAAQYYPTDNPALRSPLTAQLAKLPDRRIWQAAELIDGTMAAHRFWACHADRPKREYQIQFDDEAFLDFTPVATESTRPFSGNSAAFDAAQHGLLEKMDGARTILGCMHASGLPPNAAGVKLARDLFRTLWRRELLFFRLPKKA
jgi:hypothetical protein